MNEIIDFTNRRFELSVKKRASSIYCLGSVK